MALGQCETRAFMPSMYQLVSCSCSHVLTARISFLHFLKPYLSEPSVRLFSYRLHNFHTQHTTVCECFPQLLSPPLWIQLQLVVCNVCQTQTPFSQTTTAALSVGRPSTYTHVRNKHQCCFLSISTLLSLLWNEEKMWGLTFWATFVIRRYRRRDFQNSYL
jgi:hypothetical protein